MKIKFDLAVSAVILSAAALIISIIVIRLSRSSFINKIFVEINYKTAYDSIWDGIIDFENGSLLKIYCDDMVYTGILHEYEEKGTDSWFVLENCRIEKDGDIRKLNDDSYKTLVAANLKNVKYIEVVNRK